MQENGLLCLTRGLHIPDYGYRLRSDSVTYDTKSEKVGLLSSVIGNVLLLSERSRNRVLRIGKACRGWPITPDK